MDPRPEDPLPAPKRSLAPVLVLVVCALLAAGGFFAWREFLQPRGPQEAVAAADAGAPRPPEVDAGPALSLEDGDALLKALAGDWSADALFRGWLAGPVVRQLAAATQLVADGQSPVPALPFLSLAGPFEVREEQAPKPAHPQKAGKRPAPRPPPRSFVSPKSGARYDAITRAFTSVNAAAAGDAWARLRPYFDLAFAEIGKPGQRFDDVLAAALRRLVSVQVPEGEVELRPKGALYAFLDPKLEALSPAEKQLLRMGPANARAVQAKLREFAAHAQLDLAR